MDTIEEHLIFAEKEIDEIRFKMELGLLEKYFKVKPYCFLNNIDRGGFNFNWRIINNNFVSWEDYDGIVQRASS